MNEITSSGGDTPKCYPCTWTFLLPIIPAVQWIPPLRDFPFIPSFARQATDLLGYFDRAYVLAKKFPEKHVLGYAIARLKSVPIRHRNWLLYQNLLFQAILAEPGTFIPVLDQLCRYRAAGYRINKTALADVMNIQIAYRAPLGHGSEVAWAIWTVLVFGLLVKTKAAKALSSMSDSVVALLALDARSRGLIPSGLSTDLWAGYLTTEDLYGDQWLLSYEASVKGWLSSSSGSDHIGRDERFAWLRAIGVEFYDCTRSSLFAPSEAQDESADEPTLVLGAMVQGIINPYGAEDPAEDSSYPWEDDEDGPGTGGAADDDDAEF